MANTSKRGFASMDPAKQREIASKGGRAAHAKGTAHEFTSEEARVAGRKGGEAVSRDRAHMSAIGREGGHSRGARARAAGSTGQTRSASTGGEDRAISSSIGREESSDRAFAASERGGNGRSERSSSDSPSGHERFSSRDEI